MPPDTKVIALTFLPQLPVMNLPEEGLEGDRSQAAASYFFTSIRALRPLLMANKKYPVNMLAWSFLILPEKINRRSLTPTNDVLHSLRWLQDVFASSGARSFFCCCQTCIFVQDKSRTVEARNIRYFSLDLTSGQECLFGHKNWSHQKA